MPQSASATYRIPERGISLRAVLLGTLLQPLNSAWLVQMEMGRSGGPYPSTYSLFGNVVLAMTVLIGLNALLRRRAPRWALSQIELLCIYMMLCIGTCLASVDFLDVLLPMISHPERFADPVNRYEQILLPHLPPGFAVRDAEALVGYYEGNSTLYTARHLRAWAGPVTLWSCVAFLLLGVMLCMAYAVRRRWIDHERLPFPILNMPLAMTSADGVFWRDRTVWLGAGLAAGINLLNGISRLVPAVPRINVNYRDYSSAFTTRPWNALGWTPVSFYPFAIGLAYLLPVDLMFSCWFFYLLFKAERVLGAQFGLTGAIPRFPYVEEQCAGAYLAVAVSALWTGRRHFGGLWRHGEPGERAALALGGLGFVLLAWFYVHAGLRWTTALGAFGTYFLIALACARMRAELGPPAHDLHNAGPERLFTTFFGTGAYKPRELVALTYFYWFNRAYRSIPIAHQLEALKLSERLGFSLRAVLVPLLVATVAGTLSGFWAHLHLGYEWGLSSKMAPHMPHFGREAFGRLESWLNQTTKPDRPASAAISLGFGFALLLQTVRLRYARWPLHPLGFAVSGSYSMGISWLPMLISWSVKATVLKWGGIRGYRRSRPFFIGLVLGDYLVGCAWPIYGWIAGVPTYSFQQ